MMRTATVLGLVGLAAATGLIAWQGVAAVLTALAGAGFGIVWASLFHLVPMALNARAWQVLWPGAQRPSLWFFTETVWLREAVNGLLPVARIGGEVVSARLMMQRGLRTAPVVASLVVDMTVCIGTQFLFTVLGLVVLMANTDDGETVARIGLGLLITIPLLALLVLVQKYGLFELAARLFRALFGDRWSGLAVSSERLDRAVRLFYRRRGRILSCALWQFVAWVSGTGEIWLALYFLGQPVTLLEALLIESLAQAVSSAAFVVPGAIGVQEGGFVLFGSLLGLGPEVSLALALARRARDLLLFLPPVIAWQIFEGRRLVQQP
ncbi:MAG: hypothetical protein GC191_10500 [Azospirillum sp.]|nr:hypothetical protein [Azospirillum sp.]